MTDAQWEQYVEKAAVSIDPAAFDKTIENHDGLIRQFRRDRATELAQGVLAAVGPLIAEDTRIRMVEAAAVAVKREGGQSDPPARSDPLPDGCTSTHPMASHIPCRKAAGHPGDHESRKGRNWRPRDIGNGASS